MHAWYRKSISHECCWKILHVITRHRLNCSIFLLHPASCPSMYTVWQRADRKTMLSLGLRIWRMPSLASTFLCILNGELYVVRKPTHACMPACILICFFTAPTRILYIDHLKLLELPITLCLRKGQIFFNYVIYTNHEVMGAIEECQIFFIRRL